MDLNATLHPARRSAGQRSASSGRFRPHSGRLDCRLAGSLAGPLAGRLAGRLAGLLAGTLLLGCLGACGGPRPPASIPSIPGYEGRQEELVGRDFSPLRGRRIVLDPGHGGYFRGALGPNGLTEAEVNLGVALHLRGLLEWAGAQVWLTRTADTDFLSPADSTLAGDLAMRVSLSDSLQPDVFVSIHHNSTAALDRTINETQTYYPLDDDGASLDLARSIHRHLVLNLEIRPASIRPGNFHVLRHATVPAVLGEPAMISHPVMADRLSLASSQRLEAEAYFLGLLDYFGGGLPEWSGAPVDTLEFGGPDDPTAITWEFQPGGHPGPDPAAMHVTVDGHPVLTSISPDGRRLTWALPPTLPPRPHQVEIRGRNLAGRATPRRRTVLLPRAAETPAVRLVVADDGTFGVHWQGRDGAPLPAGQLQLAPDLVFDVGPDQPDWALVSGRPAPPEPEAIRFIAHPQAGPAAPTGPVACPVDVRTAPPGATLHLTGLDGRPYAPPGGWRSRIGPGGPDPLLATPPEAQIWLEGAGVQPLIDPAPAVGDIPGRTVAAAAPHWPVQPLLPALLGRTIVLDPAGGGTDPDGAGPLGLRGADLNLATAHHAAELLRGAGARVVLTRTDETALLPVEKVRLAGRVGADFFLTIGRHQPDGPRTVRHHPGSVTGAAWAAAAARAAALLPAAADTTRPITSVTASSAYLLRHTACPALEWRLDPVTTTAGEWRQGQPGWARAEARAVLLAVAAIAGQADVWDRLLDPLAALTDINRSGGPDPHDVTWARLDGNLAWSPLPGPAPVAGAPDTVNSGSGPGWPALGPRHVLEFHTRDDWQLWLLDRTAAGWRPTRLFGPDEPTP